MRPILSIVAALAASACGFACCSAAAQEIGRRPAHRPVAEMLPPEVPYRDPRPRFRLPPPGPGFRAPPPVIRYTVQGYHPRATNQPIYNEPPQPLR